MLKWLYFVLVAAFLAAVLWMINDMRLGVNVLVKRLDRQVPPILDNTEQAAIRINKQLPQILKNTTQAAKTINTHLPLLLKKAQQAVDQLTELGKKLRRFDNFFASRSALPGHKDRGKNANDVFSQSDGESPGTVVGSKNNRIEGDGALPYLGKGQRD